MVQQKHFPRLGDAHSLVSFKNIKQNFIRSWNIKSESYTNNPGFGELVMLSGFFGISCFYYGWSQSRTTLEKDIVTTLSVSTMLLGEE